MLVRRIARPMLAGIFIAGGASALRNPHPETQAARPVAPPMARRLPIPLPEDPEQLVKIDAGVKVVGGLALATGRMPRLASLALAGSLVPTTLAGHRFWEEGDPARKQEQMQHFLKNVGLLGGLLLATVDTAGRPSLGWRARRAGRSAAAASAVSAAAARKRLPGS